MYMGLYTKNDNWAVGLRTISPQAVGARTVGPRKVGPRTIRPEKLVPGQFDNSDNSTREIRPYTIRSKNLQYHMFNDLHRGRIVRRRIIPGPIVRGLTYRGQIVRVPIVRGPIVRRPIVRGPTVRRPTIRESPKIWEKPTSPKVL